MKKLLYSLGLIVLLITAAYYYLIHTLKESGITFASVRVQIPFSIKIKDLTIDKPNFKMNLGSAEIDLSLGSLMNSEFSGNRLYAENVDILIHPSDAPFSYSVIPVLKFNEVALNKVFLSVQNGVDTIDLSFPELSLNQLYWNDSIQLNELNYKDGRFSFRYHSPSKPVKTEETPAPIVVPGGVPKFQVNRLQINSLDLEIRNQNALTQFSNIALHLHGWNNYAGANVSLDSLSFLVQDTLKVAVQSNAIRVENHKGAGIKNLRVKLPGVDLDIREIKAKQTQSGNTLEALIGKSAISPGLIQWINRDIRLIKPNAPDVFVEGGVALINDTLKVNDFVISLLEHTKVKLTANVFGAGNLNKYKAKISPLQIHAHELTRYLYVQLPDEWSSATLSSGFELTGEQNHHTLKGQFSINDTKAQLSVKLFKDLRNHWMADLDLKSEDLELKKVAPKSELDLRAYGLHLSSFIDLTSLASYNGLDMALEVDTIVNANTRIRNLNAELSMNNQLLRLRFEDELKEWMADIELNTKAIEQQNLDFKGKLRIENLNSIYKGFKGGSGFVSFHGNGMWAGENKSAQLQLDTCTLKGITGLETDLDATTIDLQFNHKSFSVQVKSKTALVLDGKLDLEFLNWIKQPGLQLDSIPDIYVYSQMVIDSNITEMFLNQKIYAQLQSCIIKAQNHTVEANLIIPIISYKGSKAKGIRGNWVYNKEEKQGDLNIETLSNPWVDFDSLFAKVELNQKDRIHYTLKGYIPSVKEPLAIGGDVSLSSDKVGLFFNHSEPLRLGGQTWISDSGEGILIDKKRFTILGNQSFHNGSQGIELKGNDEQMELTVDSLQLGPLADLFIKDIKGKATLSMNARYVPEKDELNVNGKVTSIFLDTIDLGYSSFKIQKSYSNTSMEAEAMSSAWNVKYSANSLEDGLFHQLNIAQLDLGYVDSVLHLIPDKYEFSGDLNGKLKLYTGRTPSLNGDINFNKMRFSVKELGASGWIDNQTLFIEDDKLVLKDFEIRDEENNRLFLKGSMRLFGDREFDIGLKTEKFYVLNTQNPLSLTKGKLLLESNLLLQGKGEKIRIKGLVNLLKGGTVYHYYKGAVTLNESEDVVFTSFAKSEKVQLIKKKSRLPFSLDWNVDVNLGSTDIYVLFNKSSQEYAKLNASGNLQLRTGADMVPDIFGSVISTDGKVYYEVPMVSDIEMSISLAKLDWRGDPRNPFISFKGVETFRVTPNEMSPALDDKKNLVPVFVEALVEEKPLKSIQINFEISSANAAVQNMLAALPKETREAYAINMLVFGRINSGTESGNPTMTSLVKKMNEISRRNIKNAELSFHVDNTNTENPDGSKNANKIGYSFTKGFGNERLKITVGGDFELGQHTSATRTSPLGTIQLEYVLRENPDISLLLQRENTYRGPIEGQVDESGIVFKYSKYFKNIFRSVSKDSSFTPSR
ncbi:MAG: translocation/assembly module TamB domain-containing protein [Bacteroidia bacterium]|nr:translocation/assembly module TamB domain-containing protein [Bacteroidia bacterium]